MKKQDFIKEIGGKTLKLQVSGLAEQADAAILATYGNTVVLATVVMGKKDVSMDYFPLKVDYEERFYAAGKILGSRFVRRETRPSEEAILSGRLIDRTIRPLFNQQMRREVQVVTTVLAIDEVNDPDFVSLIAASTALAISDIPWNGPVAGMRIARIAGQLVLNPSNVQTAAPDCEFDAFVSGPKGKINMIELGGYEAKEQDVVEGFEKAQKEIDALVDFQNEIVAKIGIKKQSVELHQIDPELAVMVGEFLKDKLEDAIYQPNKMEQQEKIAELKKSLFDYVHANFKALEEKSDAHHEHTEKSLENLFEEAIDKRVHDNILRNEKRPDGRRLDEVRMLDGEVGLFERTHGSALFVRGNTQSLAITTIAPPGAEQIVESMETTAKRRFLLHYNFPPYSVGEIGSFRGPGRREIGHGALAKKAVEPLIPSKEVFPYTVRVVSEIMSSNGSSSMATVCASVLSLMDAGVPIKKPAAGIAMGIILGEGGEYKVLTDIQGPEDHYGDMDFKVAGTDNGVNAVQLDVKIEGITIPMVVETLEAAKKARLHILEFMKTIIDKPRAELSKYAPSIMHLKINPEKIGMVIGPGGKMINGLIAKYGLVAIDIDDDGSVFISADSAEKARPAYEEILSMTKEYKIGDIVEGNIIKVLDFGAIVDLGGGLDGMVHVSELREGYTKQVSDVVKVGDFVRAKVIKLEDGRIGLSIKQMKA